MSALHDSVHCHRRIRDDERLQAQRAAQQIPGVDDEQPIEMVRQLRARLKIAQHVGHRLRLAHGDDVEAHQAPDRLGRIRIGLLQKRAIDFAERLSHLPHDVVGQVVGNPREVVGIERLGDLDEAMVRRLADQPLADRRVRLDDGFGRLPRLEGGPDLQPIVGLEPLQHESQVGRMESAQPALQLGGILALLQLNADAPLRSILAVRQRFERAVMLEQRRDVLKRLMKVGCWSS